MLRPLFPLRKIRRNGAYLLFGAVLVIAAFAAYLEFVATNALGSDSGVSAVPSVEVSFSKRLHAQHGSDDNHQNDQIAYKRLSLRREIYRNHLAEGYEEDNSWAFKYIPQPWRPEYKGQANLHVFEDWCGSSVAKLRKNLHYPLYPHSRSTVKKLAVSPGWTNYGLRIFGYIHPYTDGEFVFAVASDDNCEFWLSSDENPDKLKLCAYVGKTGREWTAPGEYEKYASQISQPVFLQQQKRYYFELIHKQNDHGTDHVEVVWRLNQARTKFAIIDSQALSLYTNESSLKMNYVSHIPQTAASHVALSQDTAPSPPHGADMLREDLRDTFYQIPVLDRSRLWGVLPECAYKPSYIIKGFPLLRYQGLQFVHLLYVYPNDYTRLTHMENDNKCFYQEKPYYLERYGFSMYMKLDKPGNKDMDFVYRGDVKMGWRRREEWEGYGVVEQAGEDEDVKNEERSEGLLGNDYDDYTMQKRRKLFTATMRKKRWGDDGEIPRIPQEENPSGNKTGEINAPNWPSEQHLNDEKLAQQFPATEQKRQARTDGLQERLLSNDSQREAQASTGKPKDFTPVLAEEKEEPVEEAGVGSFGNNRVRNGNSVWSRDKSVKNKMTRPSLLGGPNDKPSKKDVPKGKVADSGIINREPAWSETDASLLQAPKHSSARNVWPNKVNDSIIEQREMNIAAPTTEEHNHSSRRRTVVEGDKVQVVHEGKQRQNKYEQEDNDIDQWELDGDFESENDFISRIGFDPEVNWAQTFQVKQLDFQVLRSDWIDLNCNVSGNLLISQSEAVAVVQAFMEKLNQKYPRQFSLQHIVNVEKRPDAAKGSRYLLELDLLERSGRRVRLAHYIYGLQYPGQSQVKGVPKQSNKPQLLLCNPHGFLWNPKATVHFIIPVKNQARWIQQFIVDMEELYRTTGDNNFNIIIADYASTDMDVEQALKSSQLPRYQYVRLNGNFQRSAGLQAGIDLITDKHSILFLCDLHIHFPAGFIDSVRKHCVEGRMAFAPIVMRLNCGATPQEPDGYWEVNGFGLLGIYKSDLDAIGGMNTRDFTDRWGGEDWELLDRIMQAGLEVERLYLRNFFHYHHSRRGMWNRRVVRNS